MRYGGHLFSRLVQNVSEQHQPKWVSYCMGRGKEGTGKGGDNEEPPPPPPGGGGGGCCFGRKKKKKRGGGGGGGGGGGLHFGPLFYPRGVEGLGWEKRKKRGEKIVLIKTFFLFSL